MSITTCTAKQFVSKGGFSDLEHQAIAAKLNKLNEAVTSSKQQADAGLRLDDVIGCVIKHSYCKEKEMNAEKYLDLTMHKAG
jgi:hemerythrin